LGVWRGIDEVYKRHPPVLPHHPHAVLLGNVSELHQQVFQRQRHALLLLLERFVELLFSD
jgi:hypothetical protein